jgi:hypothetical protein
MHEPPVSEIAAFTPASIIPTSRISRTSVFPGAVWRATVEDSISRDAVAALDAVGCVVHALRRAAARNASSVMMAFMFEA